MSRLISAFQNSVDGFRYAVRNEWAFRIELGFLVAAIPASFILGNTGSEVFLLLGAVVLILIAEILNTAIEGVCDAVSTEFDANIKVAKDCGSLAVLIACLMSSAVWIWAVFRWFFA